MEVKYLILVMSNLIWEIIPCRTDGGNEIPFRTVNRLTVPGDQEWHCPIHARLGARQDADASE